MELSLKYNEHATHPLNAAFVRGNGPAIWLQEMNAWQIPLQQLVCFIVSQNNDPNEAAGLFVIFSKGQAPGMLQVKQPYTALGAKLYIPVDAELTPAISEQELRSLLIWEYQVFHPTIGFIGFEKPDRIALADLIQYTKPKDIRWDYAQPGHSPWVPLHQINVKKISLEEVFDAFKDTVNSKPLTDIPKSNKKEVPAWLNNPVSEGLLKGAFSLLKGLGAVGGVIGIFASSGGGTAIGGNTRPAKGDGKPDLFGRMLNWMQEKIEDLERKRDSELKRLTDMFEKNVDEFLQYAIPLSSPYLNRGSASPSAHLKRNPLQFNPGRLGGGQAVDGWNLDNYYDDLRSKYVKAAHRAIANNDYKKAAYVYAHLLGDYLLAANTLKQGKHYREAAALYKDHLGSHDQAAICYEDGGLYMEAIELYLETNQHERAGDLYMQLDQKERAFTCYENCVDKAAVNKDYLEQSRIINEKIGDRPRAKNVLLEGWQDVKQPEACLTKYFDLLADDNKDQLHEEVKSFYAKGELENRKLSFLNVIEDVNKKYSSAVLESTCRNIAYEVVSEQVSTGDRASLHRLRNFIPNDQLLAPDCYRFIHTSKEAPKEEPPINNIKLMKEVVWKKVLVLQDQLLAWGVKSSGALIMARTDWEGYVEHFSWFVNLEPYHSFITLADQPNTNHIILYTRGIQYGDKPLPKNKYFRDELRVYQPPFLYPNAVGIGLYNGEIITLQRVGGEVLLNSYLLTGELKTSGRCTFKDPHFQIPPTNVNELIRCHDYYYLACDNMVLRISESGIIDVLFYSQGLIQKLVVRYIQYGLVLIGFYSGDRAFFMNSADDYKADPFEVGENDVLIKDIAILTGNRYVVANEKKVQMYYDVEGNKSPELDWEHRVENKVAAVFQGPERHQLGILEENGQITFHVIN